MTKYIVDAIVVPARPLGLGSARTGIHRVSLLLVERPPRGGLWSRQPRTLAKVRP